MLNDPNWERPVRWAVCDEVLELSDDLFLIATGRKLWRGQIWHKFYLRRISRTKPWLRLGKQFTPTSEPDEEETAQARLDFSPS